MRYFSDALANRSDVQFVEDFADFMTQRLRRAHSTEEILALLEAGVRHLNFDSVEIANGGKFGRKWVESNACSPESISDRRTKIPGRQRPRGEVGYSTSRQPRLSGDAST